MCRVYNFLFCGILIQIEVIGDVWFEGYHSNLNDIRTDVEVVNQIANEGGKEDEVSFSHTSGRIQKKNNVCRTLSAIWNILYMKSQNVGLY